MTKTELADLLEAAMPAAPAEPNQSAVIPGDLLRAVIEELRK